MNEFIIFYSEDPCFFEAACHESIHKSMIEADDAQKAVDQFRKIHKNDTTKCYIHRVYKLDLSWI